MKPFFATAALTLALVLTLGLNLAPAWAFDFNDLETVERAEQGELLERARQAAEKEDFAAARSYLGQARQKGEAPKQIKAMEALIAKNEAA
jgi:hypothetical protein